MLVEVVVPRTSPRTGGRAGVYTYRVPDALAPQTLPGQLVAVPFGEHVTPGITWALDASEDAARDTLSADDAQNVRIRSLRTILMPEPLLSSRQRSLAEWLADYYAAPLSAAVRLLLPPGLLAGLRAVLRPTNLTDEPLSKDADNSSSSSPVPSDEAVVLALLRERGWLERRVVDETLGKQRASVAIGALIAQNRVTLGVDMPAGLVKARRERVARLEDSPDALREWRTTARVRLDALPAVSLKRSPRRGPTGTNEREAEKLLRQLAALDILERPTSPADAPPDTAPWKVEDLLRLTRATPGLLDELVSAGLIQIEERPVVHDPLAGRMVAQTKPLTLTSAQAKALATIVDNSSTHSPFSKKPERPDVAESSAPQPGRVVLLHGITGSGKTEVYLQALAAVIAQGRQGIVLVPEIALTPQAVARFAGRFPGRVALLHSGLTPSERLDEWRRIREGAVDVVVGSRSAIFAPLERLGLIVVDEEHEAAYKEEQRPPTYHARDVAVRLGALTGATVVLGSATPSVESYWLARQGTYQLVELRERAMIRPPAASATPSATTPPPDGLPGVTLVDLRAELRAGNTSILSTTLQRALRETLDRGEQAILFLNRRGMASSVVCRECGFVSTCGRCDVSMTYHATEGVVLCHYCGKRERVPTTCPVCGSASIRHFGVGTERVEAAVKRQFPAARVLRWDHDTARTRLAHEELLRVFAERRADVLVGTQMIAKGLDLPGVTLVGVVSADVALHLPDFRASERAFQLLTQVAGRAGRGDIPGRVLVQTLNPEHFCVESAARHDYAGFFAAESVARERYGYPPFRRFVKYLYEHTDRYSAQIEAMALADRIEQMIAEMALPQTDLVGPAPAFMERLRGRYRWQLMVRSPDPRPLMRAIAASSDLHGWHIDVDPASSL